MATPPRDPPRAAESEAPEPAQQTASSSASAPASDPTSDSTPTTLPVALPISDVEPAVVIDGLATGTEGGADGERDGERSVGKSRQHDGDEANALHINHSPDLSSDEDEQSTSNTRNGHTKSNAPGKRPKPERPTSIVPVFWQHARNPSRTSVASLGPVGITLTDNTHSGDADGRSSSSSLNNNDHDAADDSDLPSGMKSPLWARHVDIDSHVRIEGDVPGVGGYIVWLVKVQTLNGGGSIVLRKRYSEFEALRAQLAATFPRAGESLPALPPKSVFYKFRPSFLEKRRVGLAYFLNCILLNPEFSGSPAVREFIFSSD